MFGTSIDLCWAPRNNKGLGQLRLFLACVLLAPYSVAQTWPQWGRNAEHTGFASAKGQAPDRILGSFLYDPLADQISRDAGGELLVHYMTPLVDDGDVFIMSRGASRWASCRDTPPPCGTQLWSRMQWGVTKLSSRQGGLTSRWTALSTWTPPPVSASGWEPVFHPALRGRYLYMPGGAGSLLKFNRRTGELIATIQPFGETDTNRYVISPLTVDAAGAVYYTVVQLDAAQPWQSDVREAWLIKVNSAVETQTEGTQKISFAELLPQAPVDGCVTTFSQKDLPWPPSRDASPPALPCGGQRPGVNAAPAVAPDGTIYVVSRSHLNPAYSYLVALTSDLTLKWAASLRDRLHDGCDIVLPPSGTLGGCRAGALTGVDPATNAPPAGRILDESTASPAIAPDGSIYFGALTRYNYDRGHLFHFDSAGGFLGTYDFGWDMTPAIFEHDGTWSVIMKDNHYPVGSYCGLPGFCGQGDAKYFLTSLTPDLRTEWTYQPDGEPLEWCVNMVAVDRAGTVFANSEDGNVYAVDASGKQLGHIFLRLAIGAAYTPIAIGENGVVYAQNAGALFAVGDGTRQLRKLE